MFLVSLKQQHCCWHRKIMPLTLTLAIFGHLDSRQFSLKYWQNFLFFCNTCLKEGYVNVSPRKTYFMLWQQLKEKSHNISTNFAGHETYHMQRKQKNRQKWSNLSKFAYSKTKLSCSLAEKIDLKVVCHLKFNLGLHNKMMAAIKLSKDHSRS